MKFLKYEDVPRWYHLFWDNESKQLLIRIHRFFLENCEFKNFEPYFANVESVLDFLPLFESYEPRLGQGRFGLNDSIILVAQDSDWMTYRVKLPTVLQITGMTCKSCEGTGKRRPDWKDWEDPCEDCDGTKMESFNWFGEVQEVCFSLQILLNALALPIDTNILTDKKQLFTMTTCCSQQS